MRLTGMMHLFAGGVMCAALAAAAQVPQNTISFSGVVSGAAANNGSVPISTGSGVPNRPVSATFEETTVQVLADGTRLTTTRHRSFYRDSLGRTRNETEMVFPGHQQRSHSMVSVFDPSARRMLHWIVAPGQKEYSAFDLPTAPPPSPAARIHSRSSTSDTPATLSPAGEQPQTTAVSRPQVKRENLGIDYVQGFPCEVHRNVTTFPVGFVGNDQPLVSTSERCFSEEFGADLRAVTNDPRRGTTTTTALELTRGEPDPSLFEPPAGYTQRPSRQ